MKQCKRAEGILNDAISSLQEYYLCLNDTTLAAEFASTVKVPDTGNRQLDYEAARNAIEQLAKAYEAKS